MIYFVDVNKKPVLPAVGSNVVIDPISGEIHLWTPEGRLFWARGDNGEVEVKHVSQSFITPGLTLEEYLQFLEKNLPEGYKFQKANDYSPQFVITAVPSPAV